MAFAFLNRYRTVAAPGYSRWLIPPAALCVHLCIGQAYAFSVFNLPMTKLIGISQSAPDDWKLTELGWIFSIAIFFLGASAAVFGRWVEEGGPRRAMFASALCWAGGFFVSAIGVYLHSLWIVYLGYGVLGGIGLGLGYISPTGLGDDFHAPFDKPSLLPIGLELVERDLGGHGMEVLNRFDDVLQPRSGRARRH